MVKVIRALLHRVRRWLDDVGLVVQDSVGVAGRITVREHRLEDLRAAVDGEWADLEKTEQFAVAREVPPVATSTTRNATVEDHHRHLVSALDPAQADQATASHGAVGTDNTAPAETNSTLNNEVYRTPVSNSSDQGRTLVVTIFLDATEANGHTIREAGAATGPTDEDWILLNHGTVDPHDKTEDNTLTIDIELSYQDS